MTAGAGTGHTDELITRWAAAVREAGPQPGAGASARAVAELRRAITEGFLPSGTPVPEQRVAEVLGVSRNTLREAFRELARHGLVEHRNHRGVVVRELGPGEVIDLYDARVFVECNALAAAGSASPSLLERVRVAAETGVASLEVPGWFNRPGFEFHLAVVALSRSRMLDEFAATVLGQLQLAYHRIAEPAEFHRPYLLRNAHIAELLQDGRAADAAEELRRYLREAQVQLLAAITER